VSSEAYTTLTYSRTLSASLEVVKLTRVESFTPSPLGEKVAGLTDMSVISTKPCARAGSMRKARISAVPRGFMAAILGSAGGVVKHLFGLTLGRLIDRLPLMNKLIGSACFFYALSLLVLPLWAAEEVSPFEGVVLTDLEGTGAAMDSLLDEGPLVISFWATWCSPCKLEMPHLEKLYREFAPMGVQFAAISVDRKTHTGRVKGFIEKYDLTLPVYLDLDMALTAPEVKTKVFKFKGGNGGSPEEAVQISGVVHRKGKPDQHKQKNQDTHKHLVRQAKTTRTKPNLKTHHTDRL